MVQRAARVTTIQRYQLFLMGCKNALSLLLQSMSHPMVPSISCLVRTNNCNELVHSIALPPICAVPQDLLSSPDLTPLKKQRAHALAAATAPLSPAVFSPICTLRQGSLRPTAASSVSLQLQCNIQCQQPQEQQQQQQAEAQMSSAEAQPAPQPGVQPLQSLDVNIQQPAFVEQYCNRDFHIPTAAEQEDHYAAAPWKDPRLLHELGLQPITMHNNRQRRQLADQPEQPAAAGATAHRPQAKPQQQHASTSKIKAAVQSSKQLRKQSQQLGKAPIHAQGSLIINAREPLSHSPAPPADAAAPEADVLQHSKATPHVDWQPNGAAAQQQQESSKVEHEQEAFMRGTGQQTTQMQELVDSAETYNAVQHLQPQQRHARPVRQRQQSKQDISTKQKQPVQQSHQQPCPHQQQDQVQQQLPGNSKKRLQPVLKQPAAPATSDIPDSTCLVPVHAERRRRRAAAATAAAARSKSRSLLHGNAASGGCSSPSPAGCSSGLGDAEGCSSGGESGWVDDVTDDDDCDYKSVRRATKSRATAAQTGTAQVVDGGVGSRPNRTAAVRSTTTGNKKAVTRQRNKASNLVASAAFYEGDVDSLPYANGSNNAAKNRLRKPSKRQKPAKQEHQIDDSDGDDGAGKDVGAADGPADENLPSELAVLLGVVKATTKKPRRVNKTKERQNFLRLQGMSACSCLQNTGRLLG